MQMAGIVKSGAAALVTWDDCYPVAEVRSAPGPAESAPGAKQVLSLSLILKKSARSCRVQFLGKGDYAAIAKAYRDVAKQKGYLVTWDEKLKGHADRAKYFGAANVKLWSLLSRKMNEDSTRELSVRVNWTFDEAAQVAEHLKNDLGLDHVLFIMGGWIHRGYDNQHPDILPTAPECGGDAKFTDCCRRVRALGYLLSLHDNYQDMYRDSPSYDESYIEKRADGSLQKGGLWAGGRAYITCSERAADLAKRPQNLPAVKKLSDADSYFIDTTYAAGLQECYDLKHALARGDDMRWKQALSDYAREVFGSFGSECGREWAVPHADFFEGLTGVGGGYYHDKALLARLGAAPVPLFEMVYRDCIAMYGKYGYDASRAAEYVLWHVSLGRPLNYHGIPPHLYWKEGAGEAPLDLAPVVADFRPLAGRRFSVAYRWTVGKTPDRDYRIFVHFCNAKDEICFQNDQTPKPPLTEWKPGEVVQGPFTVTVPEGLAGTFNVYIGLYGAADAGARAVLRSPQDGERRTLLGRLKVAADTAEFLPAQPQAAPAAGDPGIFVRGDGGWTEGMHPVDRFLKNTYEVLSPLNELTARTVMTEHAFLTPDRKVCRTVFGEGENAVQTVVNLSASDYRCASKAGGEAILPPYGFLVEGPTLVAFCATRWGGLAYESPAMFTVRSLDGRPISQSAKVRIFHAFGDPRIRIGGKERKVEKETTGL
jgi:hypothetical protein